MTPLKFEDKLKEKLESRGITPSENSWKKLSATLDAHEKKKPKFKFSIFSIAASIIGLLVLSFLMFNPNKVSKKSTLVINKKVINNNEIAPKRVTLNKTIQPKTTSVEITKSNEAKSSKSNIKKNSYLSEKNKGINTHNKANSTIASSNKKPKLNGESKIKFEEKIKIDTTVINTSVVNIINKVKELEENNIKVSDDERDLLLYNAQQKIIANNIFKSNTAVSASLLLQDVEEELDISFKEKVLNTLREKFREARSAVAGLNSIEKQN